jgi:hypothetical protein
MTFVLSILIVIPRRSGVEGMILKHIASAIKRQDGLLFLWN